MHHPALSFKLPYSHTEQVEIRGALLSSLAAIEIQRKHIERLQEQLKYLSFIIQQQIEDLKACEEQ